MTEVREHVEQDGIDLKRAATAAVTAALAGALAGAAKAVVDKRSREAEDDSDETRDEPVDEQPEPDEPDEPEDREEPQAEARDEAEEPEEEPDEEPEAESDEERDDSAGQNGQTGASSSDVAKIIARAKEHLEAVIGSEPEAVSGVERGNGNWRVNVEVVQMRRIPESTDILASYGVVLDDDGGLISVQEVRRYRRSQADGER